MTTILLVSEEQGQKTLLLELEQQGFHVLGATDGGLALSLIQRQQPDLIILDSILPVPDSLVVCRNIRRTKDIAHIPIILLVERGVHLDFLSELGSSFNDYLFRPFAVGELVARVRAVLRRMPGHVADGGTISAGNLRLNLLARRAFRGEEELQLSRKEFDLLAEMMRNPDIVLTRSLILSRVWGDEPQPSSIRTIDVHIRWLRQKIEQTPSNPKHIITVRGVGYRFELGRDVGDNYIR